jgi:AbrB family looped-hinge helix DNA binding protein
MASATVTSKGQITIPVKVRKALGLTPGTRVDFYEVEPGEFLLRAKTGSIRDLEGCLAHLIPPGTPPITIEEMNEAVLDHAAELDRATRSDVAENVKDGEAA